MGDFFEYPIRVALSNLVTNHHNKYFECVDSCSAQPYRMLMCDLSGTLDQGKDTKKQTALHHGVSKSQAYFTPLIYNTSTKTAARLLGSNTLELFIFYSLTFKLLSKINLLT